MALLPPACRTRRSSQTSQHRRAGRQGRNGDSLQSSYPQKWSGRHLSLLTLQCTEAKCVGKRAPLSVARLALFVARLAAQVRGVEPNARNMSALNALWEL